MKKPLIMFIILNVVRYAVDSICGGLSLEVQPAISAGLIALVGIPLGAINHILFFAKQ
ncbi:MAG: hypothetical protein HOI49_05430 [Bacteroidetes bacterium]|jgi:hypothetical protein|nr:hypothetical protein [Bacteroidota bacterium]